MRGTFDTRDLQQLACDQGAGQFADKPHDVRRADGAIERRQQELAHQFVAGVDGVGTSRSTGQGTAADGRKVLSLTDVERNRYDIGTEGLREPMHSVRRFEPA